jgi:hypothetical protein
MSLRTVNTIQYITPLKEGGSLPAIVGADDDGQYVLKFRGAGQGPKVLIAELIAGEIARSLGLPVPEIVLAQLDGDLARTEPDPEIQSLIRESAGLNLALDFLPGSMTYDPMVLKVESPLASQIVWFDAFISNVDRTPRNVNMLMWHKKLWLIDHGASLYFHYSWPQANPESRFPLIKDHVLLKKASQLGLVDQTFKTKLTETEIRRIVQLVPDDWLLTDTSFASAQAHREAYANYFIGRLKNSKNTFVQEAMNVISGHL